jgi:hypothetical protein
MTPAVDIVRSILDIECRARYLDKDLAKTIRVINTICRRRLDPIGLRMNSQVLQIAEHPIFPIFTQCPKIRADHCPDIMKASFSQARLQLAYFWIRGGSRLGLRIQRLLCALFARSCCQVASCMPTKLPKIFLSLQYAPSSKNTPHLRWFGSPFSASFAALASRIFTIDL